MLQHRTGPLRRFCFALLGVPISVVLLGLALPACKKTVTPPAVQGLALLPPDSTRELLLAQVALRSPEGTLTRVAEIAQALGFPMRAADLRAMLLARGDVPAEALDAVDLARPVTFAVVGRAPAAGAPAGQSDAEPDPHVADDEPHVAVALVLREGQDPAKALAAVGEVIERQQDAVHVRRVASATGGGPKEFWLLPRGELLLAAPTLEGLRAAGPHALAARDTPAERQSDLAVTLYPRGIARSKGTDLDEALDRARREMGDQAARDAATQGRDPEAARRTIDAMLGFYFDWLSQARAIELGALVEGKEGVRLYGRLHPRPGSALQRQVAAGPPAQLDPALLGAGTPVSVGAVALSDGFMETYLGMLEHLVTGQAETDVVLAKLRALLALVTPAYSFRWDLAGTRSVITSSGRLRAGATPDALLSALDGLFSPKVFGAFLKATSPDFQPKITWQRKGDEGRLTLDYQASAKTPRAREAAKVIAAMFGSPRLEIVTRARGDRWWSANEPGAAQRLDKLATGTAPEVDSELRRILDETAGAEGFTHLDLLSAVRLGVAVAAATEPSAAQLTGMLSLVPGLDRHRVPLIMSYRGGEHLHAELRIPGRAIEALGALIGPLRAMGLGLGGPGGPAPGNVLVPGQ